MGYYTYFTLNKIKGDDEDYKNLIDDINEKTGIGLKDNEVCEAKWYDHDDDMKTLTRKYPSLVVQFDGDGEDSDDLWSARYSGGKSEYDNDGDFCRIATKEEQKRFLDRTIEKVKSRLVYLIASLAGERTTEGVDLASLTPDQLMHLAQELA